MSETSKGQGLNKQFSAIKEVRKWDRQLLAEGMNEIRNRSGAEYVDALQGLNATLQYILRLKSNVIVDVGAGSSRGIAELSKSRFGRDLTFKGVGLYRDPAIAHNIGWEHYTLTTAEIMRGFSNESVGAFISVFGGLHYSKRLTFALSREDELLVPGGVIKLCLAEDAASGLKESLKQQLNEEARVRNQAIENFFRDRQYGIADMKRVWNSKEGEGSDRIFLAIKPGHGDGDPNEIAEYLLGADSITIEAMVDILEGSTS